MTKFLAQPLQQRRCILAFCGYGRRVQTLIPFDEVIEYLSEAEGAADGNGVLDDSFAHFQSMFRPIERQIAANTPERALCHTLIWGIHIAASQRPYFGTAMTHAMRAAVTQLVHPDHGNFSLDLAHHTRDWVRAYNLESEGHTDIIRDIFGNPFRPVTFDPDWRTSTAVALAQQMYDSRDFSAMPILADALQDAGCENAEILNHCRGPGPHVRGCWVVDLVLGKQ
jgi:hypothetical protein